MTAFREHTVGSLARIETHVDAILVRQTEDRATVLRVADEMRDALQTHTDQDTANFNQLRGKQTRMERMLNWGVGGLFVLQFIILAAIGSGLFKF